MKGKYGLILFLSLIVFFGCKTTDRATRQFAKGKTPKGHILLDTITVTAKSGPVPYRAEAEKLFDLIHTDLDVRFDIPKELLFGKALIKVKPHFYPSSELILNAKKFLIHSVKVMHNGSDTPLAFTYADSAHLRIQLDSLYTRFSEITIQIDYTAQPANVTSEGSAAITDERGLYFIDPKGTDASSPTQIWTQGEVQGSSCWFPTIDEPNQRMTQRIRMTVPQKFVTLSNGMLVGIEKTTTDSLRADIWEQKLSHAPYLAMMAAGEFSVKIDKWRGRDISYYVEPEYGEYIDEIFGNTPEMIEFYSQILGYQFPWEKYGQIVVREFVSGAMENTSATVHFDGLQQTSREMLDGDQEDIIAHELFHQWFGDLVTCESWANLPLNESFATYGEYLWKEHKYGKDEAGLQFLNNLRKYLNESEAKQENLIRFNYESPEDMFDNHSYDKGGVILHMLRVYLGDEAFFAGIKQYLTENAFQPVEAHQLRIAFEKVSGQDLNWFFNQWFYGSSHPEINTKVVYAGDSLVLEVTQKRADEKEGNFKIPVKVDIYTASGVRTEKIWIERAKHRFMWKPIDKPLLVNFDADKCLVAKITENKSLDEYLYQYSHAPMFRDRLQSLDYFAKNQKTDERAAKAVEMAMNDSFWYIRRMAIDKLQYTQKSPLELTEKLRKLALEDVSAAVREKAIEKLDKVKLDENIAVFEKALGDSSYDVESAALSALAGLDSSKALPLARMWSANANKRLIGGIADVLAVHGTAADQAFFESQIALRNGYTRFTLFFHYVNFLSRMGPDTYDKAMKTFAKYYKEADSEFMTEGIRMSLKRLKNGYETRKRNVSQELKNIPSGDLKSGMTKEDLLRFYERAIKEIEIFLNKG